MSVPPHPEAGDTEAGTLADAMNVLGPDALKVARLRVLVQSPIPLGAASALWLIRLLGIDLPVIPTALGSPNTLLWGAAVSVGFLIGGWIWAGLEVPRRAWRLSEEALLVRSGVWEHRETTLPRSRIQNVTSTSGPLQRRFGLVTLIVHTAGAHTPNVEIVDLESPVASFLTEELGGR